MPGFAAEAGARIPADGGVLVAPILTRSATPTRARLRHDPSMELRRGSRVLPSERVDLAPGWVVLRPRARTTGRITGVIGAERRNFVARAASGSALAAPTQPTLRYYAPRPVQGPRGPGMSNAYNSLALGSAPPAGAYAVVVRNAPAAGAAAGADGFALPIEAPGQTSFTFSPNPGRCQPRLPGYLAEATRQVEVLFVDALGRISAPAPTRVR
jgi:hypothetical protein